MVRYLGGYGHKEEIPGASPRGKIQETHNILLEYGDRDLDELFAERLPPVLQDEIEAFWKSLFEIANALKEFHHWTINNDGIVREYWG
jgi:hypothetical protein